ncbi:uncharacterized protein DUF2771 [Halopolyspora algeriensis]|uniref:Uncharacterized protein DUF2771 n=2 Tax=Halopolyspora algeriensis TaxID=1500506 RepID=A0A368VPF5_9ACTN|nr:uncharacterized protein DUF2771 [Halopolyspora algeriensis]TQM47604.1 uncharacterized protein DUF2771 [Halopolyspora algeriensis]
MSLLAVAGIALAGCSAPASPQVTFYSHGDSVRAAPVRHCDRLGRNCSEPNPEAVVNLTVPPGAPLQISVSEEISSAPWQVAFRYRTADGRQEAGRSTVFEAGQRHAYTLRPPGNGEPGSAQLEYVEVQRYAAPVLAAEGGIRFTIGGSWALNAHPAPPARS